MIALTLDRIAEITQSRIHGSARPADVVTGPVVIDSRQAVPGALFVALGGERVDGHDFADAAVAAGAAAVLGSRPLAAPQLLVDGGDAEVVAALGRLARAVVGELPQADIVGVTGSSGKTTTKDLLAQVLRRLGPTVAPAGSFNNEIGHPLTVLRADEHTRYVVLEVAARGLGHIAHLCRIAPPRIGVVLNVGSAHVGEFGSRAAIAQAKGELVEALPGADAGGVAVLNVDDDAVIGMAARTAARVVGYGLGERADVRGRDVRLGEDGRAAFTLQIGARSAPVRLALVGEHQVHNALAVAAVAAELGMDLDDIAAALGEAGAVSRWRMEVAEGPGGVTVVNDAYNANPESMGAALRTLAALARARRSVAVLGIMAELGPAHQVEHERLGRLVAESGVDCLIAVGEEAAPIVDGVRSVAGWHGEVRQVADTAQAVAALRGLLRPEDVVLVKGSRVAGLEQVAEQLTAEEAAK
ncbi:UDP-N-acetylmuramoyl-tripeptide--D-alanyl-D-alanine ligase [Marinitenerispora sediminis]|uniref:UDP-N-acetylmuramoyl-tripeptide--D-alanyl-D-alanine ligase n=1 Tax=Marinitenerispora sediminis TaxID=1931232 RepID=A0A368T5S4_9ACTN|nr:UDP-N-acetylmuramoyl-tripeptide--D-alanyl-D-alanine ligase [Marinitenerispora sediminis]RCV54489.1 UDP-N-acetylmuramoyl-tripeptide--D-alanyl-D-alanine ligase [Marinitenerispora sediminis]RCV58926.1 UDP-N-acetylmuramoyl-tripeptide--D-alanyl-D-alanine ligase [Marinitenerispora sediminis]RCV61353.1 UDP-N-acetylmuramoyl-tripeptide--D-alanyl-D-alanine ligase [Marinitenerispora sediminis]